jgi:SAM-dependent methyltransferase
MSNKDRFEFGENWSRFLSTLDDQRVEVAKQSLQTLIQVDDFRKLRFLDAGSGSGLFSLAASQLGAEVTSFDLDKNSVECTRLLKERFSLGANSWSVLEGSLADRDFLNSLGSFDVVYCWGVVHHTGDMWNCVENLLPLVKPGGRIVLAIYNDESYISRIWDRVKRTYQKLPKFIRPVYVAAVGSFAFFNRLIVTAMACCLRLFTFKNPFIPFMNWANETKSRGMSSWYDLVDWVGGWPFEVAKPEAVFRFMRDRGFTLQDFTTSGGHGCNEFVFIRPLPVEE